MRRRLAVRPAVTRATALLALALLTQCTDSPTSPESAADAQAALQAAASITAAEFSRLLGVIADDSMRGRATPSPQLELTAAYVASALQSAGLAGGGDGGSYLQRYVLPLPAGNTTLSAPNVIGLLEGSDARLRSEYVLVTAHMDHIGITGGGQNCAASGADSICNGANDNASGTVGVMQLARAFAALPTRPMRTLIFAVFSGEERGLWGSAYLAAHPPRPIAQLHAEINLDMLGRNATDSLFTLGKSYSTLGSVADAMTRAHPELGIKLVDDAWNGAFFARSDHYSFVKLGVPSLFFFNGPTAELHTARDATDLMNADAAARSLQMIFYVVRDVANATWPLRWDPTALARWVPAAP